VAEEARRAVDLTGGRRFVLGTGCVVPIVAPRVNLLAARAFAGP
jgi:uroporphyrinogen decarboxylase